MTPTDEIWPALPYEAWKDTCETLHMWTQIVGKVALAQAIGAFVDSTYAQAAILAGWDRASLERALAIR